MNGVWSPPLLPADEADQKIRDLTMRNAALEGALSHSLVFCHLKKSGFCYLNCKAMPWCKCSGLTWLSYTELPDSFVEAIHATS